MQFARLISEFPHETKRAVIGILGGGGKTTLWHKLGQEFSKRPSKVILTSLTRSGYSDDYDVQFYSRVIDEIKEQEVFKPNPLYIMGEMENEEKLIGIKAAQLQQLKRIADFTIFECDGARNRPIKAHQPHDPELPDFTTHAIIVVGADAVGARVDGKLVHRPELFRELWDVNANYQLEPSFIARILTSHYGYLQKVPAGVSLSYLVNKADAFPDAAQNLAMALSKLTRAPIFSGSLENNTLNKFLTNS